MTIEVIPQKFEQPKLLRRIAAFAMTGVLLAGCGSSNEDLSDSQNQPPEATASISPQPQIETEAPNPSETLAPRECSFRFVQPGENLSEENRADLTRDLAQLDELYDEASSIGVRDIAGVGRIIKDSYQDPLYVQAISQARQSIADGQTITPAELLILPVVVPAKCDDNHIEKSASQDQIRSTVSLSQSLTRQLGNRLGNRASSFTKQAYETFQREVAELQARAEKSDQQPN